MRTVLLVLAGTMLITGTTQAQDRGADTRARRTPTLEFLIGPQFGSGELTEFDDPVTFQQDLDYTGYFFKSGLTVPVRPRMSLLFRFDYDFLKSEGDFLFPLVDEFELERERRLYSFGAGLRIQLR